MEFRVLGPVELRTAGQIVGIGHARQRAVLAVLLLDLNQVVSTDRLIDRVWGEAPPASVRNVVYGLVGKLRSAITAAGRPEVVLSRRAAGYILEADPEVLDLHRFRQQVAQASAATADDHASALLRTALANWHGEALAGLSSPWLDAMRLSLEEQRTSAVLELNDIALRQGHHHQLITSLTELTALHPTNERALGQLMLALFRASRQADALQCFEGIRLRLSDEFGAHPGPELQTLHQQILRSDPLLQPLPPARPAGEAPVVAEPSLQVPVPQPHQLPAAVPHFAGRHGELVALAGLLDDRSAAGGTLLISAIAGTAGVGKTALAVQWAHQVTGRFPDGQLYVNLRGYDPGQPMPAADALAGFLRALGVPGPDIPADLEERAALYRSLLAGRRLLVVLDNASTAEQVRPLLPGTPACVAVVTSRDALAGLVARDGARRLDLDLLPLADAVGLLRSLIGDRVDAEPEPAAALAACCGRLPLALRVAAELAAARPDAALASLAAELAGQQDRLDLLDAGGDPRTAVRAVFSWSIRHLQPAAARAFRFLGLHPGPDLDAYAAAALTGTSQEQASELLAQLARAHLIQPAGPGHHALHDLLRDYARELAAADGAEEQRAAITRLFDYYLHATAAAMDTLYPAEQYRRKEIPAPAAITPPLTEPETARTWLAAELACLVTVTGHAATHGWPAHAIYLSVTLFRYLDAGSHFPEAVTIHSHARDAARRAGDAAAEAGALTRLGAAEDRQGRSQEAARHLHQALDLSRQAGDRAGEARALGNLGINAVRQAHYEQAADHQRQALSLWSETGNQVGEAIALINLSHAEIRLGQLEQAASHLQRAVALSHDTGHHSGEESAIINLGEVRMLQGHYQQAASHFHQALALSRHARHPVYEAHALNGLGEIELRQHHYQQAASHLQTALTLSRDTGVRSAETEALNLLGEVWRATGDNQHARAHHAEALALATKLDDRLWQARAHDGLARTHHADGNHQQARQHWQQALTLYNQMGTPEADHIRAQLAATDGAQQASLATPDRGR